MAITKQEEEEHNQHPLSYLLEARSYFVRLYTAAVCNPC